MFLRSPIFRSATSKTLPRGSRALAVVRQISKVYPSAHEAVEIVKSGDTLLCSGFGMCGLPNTLINALAERKDSVRNLTGVSNNAGAGSKTVGLGTLLASGQLSRLIASYLGT